MSAFGSSDGVRFNFGSPPNRSDISSNAAPYSSKKKFSDGHPSLALGKRLQKIDYGMLEMVGEIHNESPDKEPLRQLKLAEFRHDAPNDVQNDQKNDQQRLTKPKLVEREDADITQ